MVCKQCGSTVADDSLFCSYCGTAITIPETPAQESISFDAPQSHQPTEPQLKTCEQNSSPEPVHTPIIPGFPELSKKQKKKHPVAITLSIIAGILLIALVACWLTNWFGFYGPAAKIYKASERTLDSGSFAIEITQKGGEESETITFEVEIDVDRRDLAVVVSNEENEITYAIYDGYQLEYYDYGEYGSGYEKKDISDEIDAFFDAMEEAEDFDLEDFLDEMNLLDRLEDYINIKEFKKSIMSMYRNLNSNSWLKKNAGYSKERVDGATVYTFNPDLYDLAAATLEEFENCFEDNDDFEDLMDGLDGFRKYLRKLDLTVSVGVKGGKLSSFAYSTKYDDGDRTSVEFEFYNIGSTKVDADTLEDILDKATDDSDSYFDDYWY